MIPKDLRYTQEHEWIRIEGKTGTVGITDHAQEALGDITFVELPAIGDSLKQGEEACAVESAKAASSVFAPMSGKVTATNSAPPPMRSSWPKKRIRLAGPNVVLRKRKCTIEQSEGRHAKWKDHRYCQQAHRARHLPVLHITWTASWFPC